MAIAVTRRPIAWCGTQQRAVTGVGVGPTSRHGPGITSSLSSSMEYVAFFFTSAAAFRSLCRHGSKYSTPMQTSDTPTAPQDIAKAVAVGLQIGHMQAGGLQGRSAIIQNTLWRRRWTEALRYGQRGRDAKKAGGLSS